MQAAGSKQETADNHSVIVRRMYYECIVILCSRILESLRSVPRIWAILPFFLLLRLLLLLLSFSTLLNVFVSWPCLFAPPWLSDSLVQTISPFVPLCSLVRNGPAEYNGFVEDALDGLSVGKINKPACCHGQFYLVCSPRSIRNQRE